MKDAPPTPMSFSEKVLCIVGIYVVFGGLMGVNFHIPALWVRLWEAWK